jgi:tetratricopeptide (TPR) repeat protein
MGRLERLLTKADNFKEAGRYEEAISELTKALEIAPLDPDVNLSFALTYDSMGAFKQSIQCFKKALDITPNDPYLWSQLGITLSRIGRYHDALEVFHHALNLDADCTLARWNRALTFRVLGCYEDSIHDLAACAKSNANSDYIKNEIHYQLGLCYFDMGWTIESLNEMRKHVEMFPNDYWAHLSIGNCYQDLGWIDESISKFDEILGTYPDFIPAYNSLAMSLAEKGWYDEALEVLRTALRIAPNDESLTESINYIDSLKNDDDGNKGLMLLSLILNVIKRKQATNNST